MSLEAQGAYGCCRHGGWQQRLSGAGCGRTSAGSGPEGGAVVDAALGQLLPVVPAAGRTDTRPSQPAPAHADVAAQVGCLSAGTSPPVATAGKQQAASCGFFSWVKVALRIIHHGIGSAAGLQGRILLPGMLDHGALCGTASAMQLGMQS